jgi:clan AA aspartic protease
MTETRYLFGFPFATIRFKSHTIECLIDTGFDGAVMLPIEIAQKYQLQKAGLVECTLADGTTSYTESFEAEVLWLNSKRKITVVGMEADFALIGMQLLADAKTTLSPSQKILTIEPV